MPEKTAQFQSCSAHFLLSDNADQFGFALPMWIAYFHDK
jgi:hypothetical protein